MRLRAPSSGWDGAFTREHFAREHKDTHMQILFTIDQKTALKNGVNAPHSTQLIEVDPATLTQPQRDLLAEVLVDGHKAAGSVSRASGAYLSSLTLDAPTPEAVAPALDRLIARRELAAAEDEQEKIARVAKATAEYEKAITERPVKTEKIGLSLDKNITSYGVVSTTVEWEGCGYAYSSHAPEAIRERYQAAVREADARHSAAVEAALPGLRADLEVELARRAAIKAEYDALYARLPAVMRERDAAGFADEKEIERAIKSLIRADAKYTVEHRGWKNSSSIDELTDEEFCALQVTKASAPEGATVEPRTLWDTSWREAEEDEDGDEDGEVAVRENERRAAVVSWTVGGVTAKVELPLSK